MPVVLRANGFKFFFYEADVTNERRMFTLVKKEMKRSFGLTL
jgi:hypothetical protein